MWKCLSINEEPLSLLCTKERRGGGDWNRMKIGISYSICFISRLKKKKSLFNFISVRWKEAYVRSSYLESNLFVKDEFSRSVRQYWCLFETKSKFWIFFLILWPGYTVCSNISNDHAVCTGIAVLPWIQHIGNLNCDQECMFA